MLLSHNSTTGRFSLLSLPKIGAEDFIFFEVFFWSFSFLIVNKREFLMIRNFKFSGTACHPVFSFKVGSKQGRRKSKGLPKVNGLALSNEI